MRFLVLTGCLALAGCPSKTPEPLERTAVALSAGERVIDARGDATLVARELPPKPDSDGVRSLVVRWVHGSQSIALSTEDRPLADAKLTDGAVVVLAKDGVLSRVGGETRIIDRDAYGPIAVHAGKVAYVRGEQPDLEVMLAEIDRGSPRALAPAWKPAWSPAIADDGAVIFVTGRSGGLELARSKLGEATRSLVINPELAPEGPIGPIVLGDELMFERDGLVHVVGLDGRLRRTKPGVRLFEVAK